MTEMALPVDAGDAVFDEGICGGGVGNPQQGLGEAKQSDAFTRAQTIFAQEVGHVGAGGMRGARGTDQCPRADRDTRGKGWRERGCIEQGSEDCRLRGAVQGA